MKRFNCSTARRAINNCPKKIFVCTVIRVCQLVHNSGAFGQKHPNKIFEYGRKFSISSLAVVFFLAVIKEWNEYFVFSIDNSLKLENLKNFILCLNTSDPSIIHPSSYSHIPLELFFPSRRELSWH